MAVTLEPVVFRSGLAVSAIAHVTLWPVVRGCGVAVAGSKQPIAVLLHDGRVLRGFDLGGRPLAEAEVEALRPGSALALATAWRAHHDAAPDAAFSGDGP